MSAGSTKIAAAFVPELQILLDELPDAAEQAADALRIAGPELTGAALQRFLSCTSRLLEITDGIKAILGR